MNKIALVTGGNRGIGLEICRGLAKQNIEVIMGARNPADAEKSARAIGGKVVVHPLDVADTTSIEAVYDWVVATYGRLDILVNNAGVYPDEGVSIFDISLELLKNTFDTNMFGAFLLCQKFIPLMRQQNYGRVVNVSSQYGSITENMGAYTAAYKLSKLALNGMTKIFAAETRRHNIKVNTMCPGWVKTEMGGMGAPRSPEQGAETALWLATLPDDGATGGFFRDRRPIAW